MYKLNEDSCGYMLRKMACKKCKNHIEITTPDTFTDYYFTCDYCGKESDFGYVFEIYRKKNKSNNKIKTPGWIYFITANQGTQKWCKIGKATNPEKRFKELFSVTVPFNFNLFYKIYTHDDYSTLEKKIHKKFEDKRSDGEWFLLTTEDYNTILNWPQEIEKNADIPA
jgi:hypothetical protein